MLSSHFGSDKDDFPVFGYSSKPFVIGKVII
jgi:hypothetical protein